MNDNSGMQVFNGNVTADQVVVGPGASATKIVGSDPRLAEALSELGRALEQLSLSRQHKESLASDLGKL